MVSNYKWTHIFLSTIKVNQFKASGTMIQKITVNEFMAWLYLRIIRLFKSFRAYFHLYEY